jgi:hypothetical protein
MIENDAKARVNAATSNGHAQGVGKARSDVSVVFVEVNEADRHFLEKFIKAGKLPTLARMRQEGAFVTTRIPGWSFKDERSWREIMPWIIWPSLYTGLPPSEHGIVAFGQDTRSILGKCIWDVLD